MRADVKVGDKWLEADFGFYFLKKEISPPEVKTCLVEIPGTSDVIDLTEAISGDIEYKQREITIVIEYIEGKDYYYGKSSQIANHLHGKKLKIIFSKDSGYYWLGRLKVESMTQRIEGQVTTITIKADVDPYKYETQSSLTPWQWDTFSFNDGIIRDYYDITVPGTVTIIGRRKRVCPKIIASTAMTVTYLNNVYSLLAGENVIPDIYLGEGEHVLTFLGSGKVSIDYQGASL